MGRTHSAGERRSRLDAPASRTAGQARDAACQQTAGHRRPAEAEGRVYQQLEIDFGPFRRVIELGADVVADEARATYRDGMLRIELPLVQPEPRARTVPIEVDRSGEVLEG